MGTFTEEEATACFASYAGLDEANANSDAVKEIVARLGSIPLAIAMAALYFRNAAGTVDELSAEYFAQLEALEDIGSIPQDSIAQHLQPSSTPFGISGQGLLATTEST